MVAWGSIGPSRVFRTQKTRIARGGDISYGNNTFVLANMDGLVTNPGKSIQTNIRIGTITGGTCCEHHGKKLPASPSPSANWESERQVSKIFANSRPPERWRAEQASHQIANRVIPLKG